MCLVPVVLRELCPLEITSSSRGLCFPQADPVYALSPGGTAPSLDILPPPISGTLELSTFLIHNPPGLITKVWLKENLLIYKQLAKQATLSGWLFIAIYDDRLSFWFSPAHVSRGN